MKPLFNDALRRNMSLEEKAYYGIPMGPEDMEDIQKGIVALKVLDNFFLSPDTVDEGIAAVEELIEEGRDE